MKNLQNTYAIWLLLLSAVTVVYGRSLPNNGLSQNRTQRNVYCYEDEYPVNGICCQRCPAGSHVFEHCTTSHQRGFCISCMEGKDYTTYDNGLEQCIPCNTCRPDQAFTKECTVKTDAACECRPGYFCTPDEPCEACSRCSRCLEGQRVKDQCTATRDTVCEDVLLSSPDAVPPKNATTAGSPARKTQLQTDPDPTDDRTDSRKDTDEGGQKTESGKDLIWMPLSLAALFIIAMGFFIYFKTCRKETQKVCGSEISLVPPSTVPSTDSSVQSTPVPPRNDPHITEQHPQEEQPLIQGSESAYPVTVIVQTSGSDTQATPGPRAASEDSDPTEDDVEEGEEPTGICTNCSQVFPCDCQWSDFCYTLIDHVPTDLFLRLVRSLRLNDTVIERIIKDNHGSSIEQSYKMLQRWREQTGNQANMGTVLQILRDMGLDGCCENIINSLKLKKNTCKLSLQE